MIERAALSVAVIDKDAPGKIGGWASTYGNVDRLGRVMLAGAFGSTLGGKSHAGMNFTSYQVPMLAYHDDTKPVGSSKMLPLPEQGMKHESGWAATEFAKEMQALVDAGAIPATSIGWDPFSAVWTTNAQGFREYSYIDQLENSLCPCPANPLAILEAASMAGSGAPPAWEKDVPDWVKELWPDFARASFGPVEIITLSSRKEQAAGARHSAADQGQIQAAHDSLAMAGATCDSGNAAMDDRDVATWSAAAVNGLPDASFALILGGGTKDDDGTTVPRSLRKLPYKDAEGQVDKAHVRNALARVDQTQGASAEDRAAAKRTLLAAAKSVGIDTEAAAALMFSRRERAAIQGSYEELEGTLGEALRNAYPGRYPWIRATFADSVVYDLDGCFGSPGGTFRVSYILDPVDGDVEFGVPEEVDIKQVIVPEEPDVDNDRLASLELDALEFEAEAIEVG